MIPGNSTRWRLFTWAIVLAMAVGTAPLLSSAPASAFDGESFFSARILENASVDGSLAVVSELTAAAGDSPTARAYLEVQTFAGGSVRALPQAISQEWATTGTSRDTFAPRLTADGSAVVAFSTAALTAGDTDVGGADLYRYDAATSTYTLLSPAWALPAGWRPSGQVFDISDDGSVVAFALWRPTGTTDLQPMQIALFDTNANIVRLPHNRVTVSERGPRSVRLDASLSGDGRIAVYTSGDQTLPLPVVPPIARSHLRRFDWNANTSTVIVNDVNPSATAVSANGKIAVFESKNNPVPGATAGVMSLYTHNSTNGVFKLVANRGVMPSIGGSVSKNGRYIAFSIPTAAPVNHLAYVRDMTLAETLDIAQPDAPVIPNGEGYSLVTDSGNVVLGSTTATNLTAAGNTAGSFRVSLAPRPGEAVRLVDTRPKGVTVDGADRATGVLVPGSTTVIQVAGRGGIPFGVKAAVATIVAVSPDATGYISVHPCVDPAPTASTINLAIGVTRANTVLARLDDSGRVCVTTVGASTHLVLDVNDVIASTSSFTPVDPARLLDTRSAGVTVDGQYSGIGARAAGATTRIRLRGRGGVPASATSVAVNVTGLGSRTGGSVTMWNCAATPSNSITLSLGAVTAHATFAIVPLDAAGDVCVRPTVGMHLLIDALGSWPTGGDFSGRPSGLRVLDTRPTGDTIDRKFRRGGRTTTGGTIELKIGGRAGVPDNGVDVALNVIAISPSSGAFVTVFPCGTARPLASNLNVLAKRTANSVAWVRIPVTGKVCIYTSSAMDLIAEVQGHSR